MKIGTKLAICFIALAVLPLGAASVVYLRATSKFGADMAERGKNLLAERVHLDIRRATETGAVSIEQTRTEVAREVRFLAGDIASRLEAPGPVAELADGVNGFLLAPDQTMPTDPSVAQHIDLQHMSVHIAPDASRDQIASSLNRLAGFNEVARLVYLRNRGAIDTLTITFESGLTISYPGMAARLDKDPREQDWYLRTLETSQADWFDSTDGITGRMFATAPIQLDDGQLAGAVRVSVRLDVLLTQSLDATRLPPDASAHLFAVPNNDPELMPHKIAVFSPENGHWEVLKERQPISLNGNDLWIKVVSDIRSGVPGLEEVELDGRREVWAFGPVGATNGAVYHIAVSFPAGIINAASEKVEAVVQQSYRDQLRTAIVFALIAGLIAAALAVFGAKTLTSPVRRLHEAAARLARGDFSVRIQKPGGDELGDLGRDFNRMVPALEEQIRVKRDLHAAQEIQQHLIPATAPAIDGFDLAGKTIYCDETGGDYQDYVPLDDHRYAIVIGDVTGHGVGAALLMASARAVLRANAPHEKTAADVLAAVNRQLSADSPGGRSLTLFYMQLEAGKRDFSWISAGHEPVLIYEPEADTFSLLDGEDIPLGVDAEWTFSGQTAALPDGGLLVAYTDGLREALNEQGMQFGLDRLKSAIRKSHARGSAAILDAILSDLAAYRGNTEAHDDVSVLVIKPLTQAV
ncbi:SpoIIE family protein phosphatase [Thalassospiraceae bacterium LMO-JJ14]|nr:SpoIIE family protein phosphatase [Thalassospiraceae bacterium LMO-JJ14]